jgi:periplasmic protein CpxP/Spy
MGNIMDLFNQTRFLRIAVFILFLMNLMALTLLWIGRPEGKVPHSDPQDPVEEIQQIRQMLNRAMGFDELQIDQYLELREDHHKQTLLLSAEIRRLKKQMFDEVLKEIHQDELSDSLLVLTQEKQAQIEKLTFQHFLALKEMCKPEQRKNLKLLMQELFRQPPPSGMHPSGRPRMPPAGLNPHNRRPAPQGK